MSNIEILIRFAVAAIIGAAVGFERELSGRPAGLRTHLLVCVSACLVMLSGEFLSQDTQVDPTRMGAQVISGIGFLGAGTILREGFTVKGLTTAATLWAVACIGLACGGGFYYGAMIAGFIILACLTILERFERYTVNKKGISQLITIICNDKETHNSVSKIIEESNLILSEFSICKLDDEMYRIIYNVTTIPKLYNNTKLTSLSTKIIESNSIDEISIKANV